MQFGRLMGISLAGLGLLLIILQLGFFLNSARAVTPAAPLQTQTRHVPLLPGILGGALLIGGSVLFFAARLEDEPDRRHAIK